jgi:outer membrane immunogenic protein
VTELPQAMKFHGYSGQALCASNESAGILFCVCRMGLLMRRLSLAIIAAVSTVALTQVASAADLPRKAPAFTPPPPPVYSWTGFYIGANIGGGWGSRDVDYLPNDPATASFSAIPGFGLPPSVSFRSSGVIGGLQLGYNWQFNRNWLVGLETDFDWSGIKGSGSSAALISGIVPYSTSADERIQWFGTLRARLGYLPVENLLAYVTGGFAYGRVDRNSSYFNNSNNVFIGNGAPSPVSFQCNPFSTCFTGSSNDVATGWTLGGGLEYAFWQKWTIKVEYLYVSLSSKSFAEFASGVFNLGDAPASYNANFNRTNFNVARVGVNYRF